MKFSRGNQALNLFKGITVLSLFLFYVSECAAQHDSSTKFASANAATINTVDSSNVLPPIENDLKSGCSQILSELMELICNSSELRYFNRNFYYLYSITKNNRLGDKWTNFSTPEKWAELVSSNQLFLERLSKCKDELCIGNIFIDRACYVRDLRFNNFTERSPSEEGLVFHKRVAYHCNSSGQDWNSFLKLTGPYFAKHTIKDIKFSIRTNSKNDELQVLCEEYIELLNRHVNKEELRCGLPDFDLNQNFEKIKFEPITKNQLERYESYMKKRTSNIVDSIEIAIWPAYLTPGTPDGNLFSRDFVTIRRPLREACVWDETGNPDYTTAWSNEENRFASTLISDRELSRLGRQSTTFQYETISTYSEQNAPRKASFRNYSANGQLFKYKGITYISNKNYSITPYSPIRRKPMCKIKSNVTVN